MVLYDYQCPSCFSELEVAMKMGDTSPVFCPVCNEECRKVIRATPTHFVGSGWTEGGYKRGVPVDE